MVPCKSYTHHISNQVLAYFVSFFEERYSFLCSSKKIYNFFSVFVVVDFCSTAKMCSDI